MSLSVVQGDLRSLWSRHSVVVLLPVWVAIRWRTSIWVVSSAVWRLIIGIVVVMIIMIHPGGPQY